MKNFCRAIRLSLRYRMTLLGLLTCSFLVAILWGGNIGALYPIVEVAFQGKSLQDWATQQIAQAERKSAEVQQQLQRLQAERDQAPADERPALDSEIASLQSRYSAEQTALNTVRWLQPKIQRYLPSSPFHTIVAIVVVLMVATVVKDLFIFANNMLVERLVQLVAFDLRKELFQHTLRMDLNEFGEQRTGTLMARFSNELGCVAQGLSCLFGRAFREPLKGFVCLLGAGYICWRLLVFSMLLTPLAALLMRQLAGSLKRANRRAMQENSQLMGVLSESFTGMQTIKAYTMEKYERRRFHKVSKECLRKALRIVFYDALSKPATELLGMAVVFIALIAGAYLVLNQETHLWGIRMCERPLSVAALLCFYGLLVGTSDPGRKMTDIFNGIQAGIAAADRLFPILDRQPAIVDPPQPRPAPRPHRELVFEHVEFHYLPDRPILRGINLTVPFGETLCIVGPNGCGKTTLANLLPRFFDPVAGAVRLDDVDLRELRLRELRRLVGVVTQQTLLFDDTVFNNIRYGSLNATRADVIQAAQQAHAHRFIEDKLDHGYDTIVGPGGNRLSGGQRQRIALARAILRNPDILILDEATSQIDVESEQLIHRALEQFVRHRTAIIITHRLSTLELADRILVMEAGRIVDLGTHDELLRRCETYQRLREIQFRQSA